MKKALTYLLLFSPLASFAASSENAIDLTNHLFGYLALVIFVISYSLVMVEEYTHFRKSKPVILAAGLIWALIGWIYASKSLSIVVEEAITHNIIEYAELLLFLLVAMTYIESMRERLIFEKLKVWLINKGFSFRQLFWITGFIAFFMSPIADNLTTSLVMGAVVLAVGAGNARFISISFVNIVVAANAGGAFSPFGDITTLMVWQEGIVEFEQFFSIFVPSFVNFIIPSLIMQFFIQNIKPSIRDKDIKIKQGGIIITIAFLFTIFTAVSFHNFMHLPPSLGMMTGLGYLMVIGYFIKISEKKNNKKEPFDIFRSISNAEWDTLLFFFGIILSVGGLGLIGYLALISEFMYIELGATYANVLAGIISAIIDNIPVMFAIITMNPDMSLGQWLLITLTAGTGGSLLSIGSAAGVALMGQSKGYYTFVSHLKWIWAIALGYFASVIVHLWINKHLMNVPIG